VPTKPDKLVIGIPKGSLEESTLGLFAQAGFRFYGSERSLWLTSNDREIEPVLLRPQEIPLYVADGSLDCGLAGWDWVLENGCEDRLRMLADLCYSKRTFRPVRWVLAVAQDSPFKTIEDLRAAPPPIRITTELQRFTESWLSERGIEATVSFSWGATEAKVPLLADALVECTETGSSLRANGLRIVTTLLESTTRFFANKEVHNTSDWKRAKLDGIALLLKSCLAAETKVVVHARVPRSEIEVVEALIPREADFSVWEGRRDVMLLEIVMEKEAARDLVPLLARHGALKVSLSPMSMFHG
jgi:ATP phosphoribosyltransferase